MNIWLFEMKESRFWKTLLGKKEIFPLIKPITRVIVHINCFVYDVEYFLKQLVRRRKNNG